MGQSVSARTGKDRRAFQNGRNREDGTSLSTVPHSQLIQESLHCLTPWPKGRTVPASFTKSKARQTQTRGLWVSVRTSLAPFDLHLD